MEIKKKFSFFFNIVGSLFHPPSLQWLRQVFLTPISMSLFTVIFSWISVCFDQCHLDSFCFFFSLTWYPQFEECLGSKLKDRVRCWLSRFDSIYKDSFFETAIETAQFVIRSYHIKKIQYETFSSKRKTKKKEENLKQKIKWKIINHCWFHSFISILSIIFDVSSLSFVKKKLFNF